MKAEDATKQRPTHRLPATPPNVERDGIEANNLLYTSPEVKCARTSSRNSNLGVMFHNILHIVKGEMRSLNHVEQQLSAVSDIDLALWGPELRGQALGCLHRTY